MSKQLILTASCLSLALIKAITINHRNNVWQFVEMSLIRKKRKQYQLCIDIKCNSRAQLMLIHCVSIYSSLHIVFQFCMQILELYNSTN